MQWGLKVWLTMGEPCGLLRQPVDVFVRGAMPPHSLQGAASRGRATPEASLPWASAHCRVASFSLQIGGLRGLQQPAGLLEALLLTATQHRPSPGNLSVPCGISTFLGRRVLGEAASLEGGIGNAKPLLQGRPWRLCRAERHPAVRRQLGKAPRCAHHTYMEQKAGTETFPGVAGAQIDLPSGIPHDGRAPWGVS